ncbi:MAG: hypothetical protein IKJ58_08230 [Akkermansia sp.]|nr:hypothetical protein [Akkermansia sp.]
MTRLWTMLSLLVTLLLMPAVGLGAFVKDCGCGHMEHVQVCQCHCEGHEHGHDSPRQHGCLHESYQLQLSNTEAPVPVILSVKMQEVSLPGFCCEQNDRGLKLAAVGSKWPDGIPPGHLTLPLLI